MKEWEGGQSVDQYVSSTQLFSISFSLFPHLTLSFLDVIFFLLFSQQHSFFFTPLTIHPFFHVLNPPLIYKLILFSHHLSSFLVAAYFQRSSPGATFLTVTLFLHSISLSSSCLHLFLSLYLYMRCPPLSLYISFEDGSLFLSSSNSSLRPLHQKKGFFPFFQFYGRLGHWLFHANILFYLIEIIYF